MFMSCTCYVLRLTISMYLKRVRSNRIIGNGEIVVTTLCMKMIDTLTCVCCEVRVRFKFDVFSVLYLCTSAYPSSDLHVFLVSCMVFTWGWPTLAETCSEYNYTQSIFGCYRGKIFMFYFWHIATGCTHQLLRGASWFVLFAKYN
jgi:hypothetical protein